MNQETPLDGSDETGHWPVPEGWRIARIGDIIKPDREKMPKHSYQGQLPLIDRIRFDTGKIELRQQRKTRTDLLVAESGRLAVSKINFHQGAIAVTDQRLAATTHFEFYKVLDMADIGFLWYCFRFSKFIEMISERIRFGGYKKEANYNFVREFRIPLPSLAEQKRIVEILSMAQDAKEKTESVIKALTEFKMALREYLFAYGPTPFPDAMTMSKNGFPVDNTPEEWRVVTLGSLLREKLKNGHSARGSSSENGIRTLTLSAVTNNDFSIHNTKITDAEPEKVHGLWLRPGDILIERANTKELVGLAARYDGPDDYAIFPDLMVRVRVSENEIDTRFLTEYLLSVPVRNFLRGKASGTASSMPKITHSVIASIPVRVPSLTIQHGIAAMLQTLDRKLLAETKRKEALEALFTSLLDNLMTGRLMVREGGDAS